VLHKLNSADSESNHGGSSVDMLRHFWDTPDVIEIAKLRARSRLSSPASFSQASPVL
jgi:hypothetical protein